MRTLTLFFTLFFSTYFCYSQVFKTLDSGLNGKFGTSFVTAMGVFKNNLYISGGFKSINNTNIGGTARWNGSSWDSVGCPSGIKGNLRVIKEYKDELACGGNMQDVCDIINETGAGDLLIVNWNDSSWRAIARWVGSPSNFGTIYCMAVYNGELYVGGTIMFIGGKYASGIARWDGSQWRSVRAGITGGWRDVRSMAVYNDELYIGGNFTGVDSQLCLGVAKWNGTVWSPVGGGVAGGSVGGIVVDSIKNILYAIGGFQYAEGVFVNGVAKWDGNKWDSVGSPITNGGGAICMYRNKLFVGGPFDVSQTEDTVMASWDGVKWTPITGHYGSVNVMTVFQDKLIIGGSFVSINGDTLKRGIAAYYEPPLGIPSKEFNKELNIYPNPSNNNITYHVDANQEQNCISIINSKGQVVYQNSQIENMSPRNTINISNLTAGVYMLIVSTRENNYSGKFIVTSY